MNENCILREDRDGVCYLTLNRPGKLNALDSELFGEMNNQLEEIERRDDLKVVVLRGAGRCFCAGHDVAVLGMPGQDETFNSRVITRLASLPQAVVMLIHSHCYTGGLELALAGDIIIASENAKIGDTHSKFALRPIWGLSQRLPRRVGVTRAKDMFFTNRIYSGKEAAAIGLADYCFPDDAFAEMAETVIEKIKSNSAYSISYMKQILRDTDGQNEVVGLEKEVHVDGILGPDFEERISVLTKK